MSKNTIIDGIAASEHLDSSGESLSIEGMDISSLGGPDSILNWEHGSKERPSQVVGKITFAKKIMKKDDAKTKREIYFWNKAKKPFVYIKAELFDGLGHSGAQDVSAMLKYKNKDKGEDSRLIVGFSIEGGKIEKKGMTVTKSIARDVAITVKPCNKVCDAEVLENNSGDEDFLYKNQEFDCEILEKNELPINTHGYRNLVLNDIKKGNWKEKIPSKEEVKEIKLPKKITEISKNYETDNNMRKALIAGIMNISPDAKTGMAALAPEEMVSSKKKIKKSEEDVSHDFLKPHTMFSVENPYHPAKTSITHEDMLAKLKNKGFDAEHINGKYGNKENSIIVKNPTEKQREILNHIARKLGQDSIIHSDGKNHKMLYLHGEKAGQHAKGSGTQIFQKEPEDFYSTTSSGTHFAHNFDFDNLHKTEVLEKMSRPLMQNKELELGQDPRMDVKTVNKDKEYTIPAKKTPESNVPEKKVGAIDLENKKLSQMARYAEKQKSPKQSKKIEDVGNEYKNLLNPQNESAANVRIPGATQKSYEYTENKKPNETKVLYTSNRSQRPDQAQLGYKIHETTHGFFSDLKNKHGNDVANALSDRLLSEHFHKEDRKNISDWVKKAGYDPKSSNFNEEHITHVADILNNPKDRQSFYKHLGFENPDKIFKQIPTYLQAKKTGQGLDKFSPEEINNIEKIQRIDKRLKRGWENATQFTNNPLQMADFINQNKSLKNNKKISKE